jgi:hypothetical protein
MRRWATFVFCPQFRTAGRPGLREGVNGERRGKRRVNPAAAIAPGRRPSGSRAGLPTQSGKYAAKRLPNGGSLGEVAISVRVIVTVQASWRGTNINRLGEIPALEAYPVRCRIQWDVMDRADRLGRVFHNPFDRAGFLRKNSWTSTITWTARDRGHQNNGSFKCFQPARVDTAHLR